MKKILTSIATLASCVAGSIFLLLADDCTQPFIFYYFAVLCFVMGLHFFVEFLGEMLRLRK